MNPGPQDGPQNQDIIKYIDHESKKICEEKIYGEGALRFAYETTLGKIVTSLILTKKIPSKIFGAYKSSPHSAKEIPEFIRKYKIPIQEYESVNYKSFNDFFIRKFKKESRQFVTAQNEMPASCEGRWHCFERIDEQVQFPVKGKYLNISTLLNATSSTHNEKANIEFLQKFKNGPMMICRLCPTDYHRFHFPDSGVVLKRYTIPGPFHSVSPIALKVNPEILVQNEREVTLFESENFGLLGIIEVGAIFVGKIVQSYDHNKKIMRGDEKGYFLFGGSTQIIIGEKGKWIPHSEFLENTRRGLETLIKLGQSVAQKR